MANSDGPVTLLILGASGDLTRRLLLPGLGSLLHIEPDRRVELFGVGRSGLNDKEWQKRIREAFQETDVTKKRTEEIVKHARWLTADATTGDHLKWVLEQCSGGPVVIYFALPPAVTIKICALLETLDTPADLRLALEKPFGEDEKSAHELNLQLQRVVPEHQIFRIDHFMGTATVLNLIGLRFANRIMEPIWNHHHIERVEILYDEALALEGRAGYYDTAGALRDMLQSHLLQVMAIFAMEPIAQINSQELSDLKAQVLRSTHLWQNSPKRSSRRARYTAGIVNEKKIPSYVDEDGVDPSNMTETLAQLKLEVRTSRWAGVPITLRSGKALGEARKEIVCYFRPVGHVPEGFGGDATPDRLIIRLKPGAVSLELTMNAEGDPLSLERKELTAELGAGRMTAYGEVLRETLDGSPLLSLRNDVAELGWRVVDPVLAAWARNDVPLEEYAAGTAGPEGWLPASSVVH
ncbi:glucose-6-phosphate dehydrogenase [Dermatophilaceae bacterium Sec6.4]|nr:glucose-6-phosphate dehydrogenase [Actinomycetota bacterium]